MQVFRHLALIVLAALAASATHADAHPLRPFDKVLTSRAPHAAPRRLAPQCENFTGTWETDCNGDPNTIVIAQRGCAEISADGQDLPINGAETATKSIDGHTSQTLTVLWNDAQTKLRVLQVISMQASGFTVGGMATSSLWLADDKLHIANGQFQAIDIDGAPLWADAPKECVYTRVAGTK